LFEHILIILLWYLSFLSKIYQVHKLLTYCTILSPCYSEIILTKIMSCTERCTNFTKR